MKKQGIFYTDNKDFVFIPNENLHKQIFGNTKKDVVLYIKKLKKNYRMTIKYIAVEDLVPSGFIKINDVPKDIIEFLNIELKNI